MSNLTEQDVETINELKQLTKQAQLHADFYGWVADVRIRGAAAQIRYLIRHPIKAVRFARAFNKAFPR